MRLISWERVFCWLVFGLFLLVGQVAKASAVGQEGVSSLKGTLFGVDGKPMSVAHIQLKRRWFRSEHLVQEIKPDAKGKWSLSCSKKGLFLLVFSGRKHKALSVLLALPLKQPVHFDVRLSPLHLVSKPKKVRLRLVSVSPQMKWSVPMKQGKAGEYIATIKKTKRTVWAQVSGLALGSSVPVDGGEVEYHQPSATYRTRLKLGDAPLTLRFRPSFSKKAVAPSLVVTPASVLDLHELRLFFSRERRRVFRAYRAFRKAKKRRGYVRYSHDYRRFDRHLKNLRRLAAQDPFLTNAIDLFAITMPFRRYEYKSYKAKRKRAQKLVDTLPPDSALWGLRFGLFYRVLLLSSYERYERYKGKATRAINAFLQKHPNPSLKMGLLRRKISLLTFYQRYYGKKYKKYLAHQMNKRRSLGGELRALLKKYDGEILTRSLSRRLANRILVLAAKKRAPKKKIKGRKLFLNRYYMKHYRLFDTDPKYYLHLAKGYFAMMQAISKKHRAPSLDKYVRRARWKLFPSVKKGMLVPPFRVPLLDQPEKALTHEQLKGRHTLLVFWATWCGPCVRKMPLLHGVYKHYKKRGLRMVSISIDRDPQKVRAFRRKKWPIPWDNAVLRGPNRAKVQGLFQVAAIPRMVLIGPKGVVVAGPGDLSRQKSLLEQLRLHLGASKLHKVPGS